MPREMNGVQTLLSGLVRRQHVANQERRDFLCRRSEMPLDCLVCNAAVYLPTAKEPRFTADGFEISVGTNHLGHFLLANLLLEDLKQRKETAKNPPRMVIVGSITGNTNTVAGKDIGREPILTI